MINTNINLYLSTPVSPCNNSAFGLFFFQNLRQPYTNAAEDVDENGEAVHCTKYLQTAFWLRIGKSE